MMDVVAALAERDLDRALIAHRSPHCARWSSFWSARTSAIIASTTGAPRMPTQGSWRPLVRISVASPSRSMVSTGRQDRAGRLERDAHDHRLAGRDAAGDAAGMVGEELGAAVRAGPHRVGILLAAQPRRGEAVADLDALDRVDRHHRRGEVGVELGVDRRAPAGGNAGRDAFDHRAERGAGLARLVDQLLPARRRRGVGAEEGIGVDLPRRRRRPRSIASPPISTT